MDIYPHERLLQLLSTMLIEINALQVQTPPVTYTNTTIDEQTTILNLSDPANHATIHTGLQTLEQLTHEALTILRTALEDQLPPELEELTLAEVLSRLVEESAERLGIASRISFSGVDEQGQPREREHTLSPRAQRLFLLLTREALYGIEQRHDVHRLRLTFNYSENEAQLNLEDDGLNSATAFRTGAVGIVPRADPVPTEVQNNVSSNTHILQQEQTIPLFEQQTESLAHRVEIQAQEPIIEDLRRRFEQIGGSLIVRVLEPRGIRVQASIPYSRSRTTPQTTSTPDVGQARLNTQPETLPLPAPLPRSTETIRILIVDGQAVSRAGLHHLLESYRDLHIVGEAADGVQAVSETLELSPQVILMDTHLPEGQSLEALRQIKQLNPDTKVLLLATQDREEYLYETLRAGADGYILKDIVPDELAQAIRTVARGDMLIQPQIASRLIARYGQQSKTSGHINTLTNRELEVFHLLTRGLRNKEIAARLYVSERTINFHLTNIYQKLQVSGRTEALSKALEQGLITPP